MKTVISLVAALCLATPVAAATLSKAPTPNRTPLKAASTVRSHWVYTVAWQACPMNVRLAGPKNQNLEFLTDVAKSAKMTVEESNLLVMMCFMYDRGAHSAT